MAIRLPALCGELSRAEAEQVLKLGVNERNKMLGHCRTLTKQRREVFSSLDGGIKKLEKDNSAAHVELVPGSKTGKKTDKSIEKSRSYLDGRKPPDLAPRRACFGHAEFDFVSKQKTGECFWRDLDALILSKD